MANVADLKLIQIPEFPKTDTLVGSGPEYVVLTKADGVTYGMLSSDFKAFLGTVQVQVPKALAPTDPAPTLSSVYYPTVTQNEAGTPIVYANAGGIEVNTAEGGEDYGKQVQLIYDGTDWVKVGIPLLKSDVFLESAEPDFTIEDEENNAIAAFSEGHIRTKEFDSKDVNVIFVDDSAVDYSVKDEQGNRILEVTGGHIKTKDFDSETVGTILKLKGKKISFLGDSITTFTGWIYPGNRARYPQSDLLTDVNLTYWKKLIDKTQMQVGINESWAGSRVSWDGVTESTDIGANKHIASIPRIGHLGQNGSPDIILAYAATNDVLASNVTIGTFNTESPRLYTEAQILALPVLTFADAYRTMIIRLMYYYKSAQIVVMLPNVVTTGYTLEKLNQYCEMIITICDFFGIKYIDTRKSGITIMNIDDYLPDGVHPNSAGMDLIYEQVYNFFMSHIKV